MLSNDAIRVARAADIIPHSTASSLGAFQAEHLKTAEHANHTRTHISFSNLEPKNWLCNSCPSADHEAWHATGQSVLRIRFDC